METTLLNVISFTRERYPFSQASLHSLSSPVNYLPVLPDSLHLFLSDEIKEPVIRKDYSSVAPLHVLLLLPFVFFLLPSTDGCVQFLYDRFQTAWKKQRGWHCRFHLQWLQIQSHWPFQGVAGSVQDRLLLLLFHLCY